MLHSQTRANDCCAPPLPPPPPMRPTMCHPNRNSSYSMHVGMCSVVLSQPRLCRCVIFRGQIRRLLAYAGDAPGSWPIVNWPPITSSYNPVACTNSASLRQQSGQNRSSRPCGGPSLPHRTPPARCLNPFHTPPKGVGSLPGGESPHTSSPQEAISAPPGAYWLLKFPLVGCLLQASW